MADDERTEEQILAGIQETRKDRDTKVTLDIGIYEGTVGYSPNEGNKKIFTMNRQTLTNRMAAAMLRELANELDPQNKQVKLTGGGSVGGAITHANGYGFTTR